MKAVSPAIKSPGSHSLAHRHSGHHHHRNRLLFILKRRHDYDRCHKGPLSSGLRNSVGFMVCMLRRAGICADMVEVTDNNEIDRQVAQFRPTHCIIEALWVVPEKFDVLKRLHPDVHWIVRNHSEIPFLANEGNAFAWIGGYLRRGIEVMCNAPRAWEDLKAIAKLERVHDGLVTLGPNYYPIDEAGPITPHMDQGRHLHISCFGAIRPLKNHLAQAIAALEFARIVRKPLRFHINNTRVQGGGESILKNLRALFAAAPAAELVEHDWLAHDEFVALYGKIDIALQVSLSETYNICAADAVAASVPVVVSPEVPWIGEYAYADPVRIDSIVEGIASAWNHDDLDQRLWQQREDLRSYNTGSRHLWIERFA